jgi:hypothetical protein
MKKIRGRTYLPLSYSRKEATCHMIPSDGLKNRLVHGVCRRERLVCIIGITEHVACTSRHPTTRPGNPMTVCAGHQNSRALSERSASVIESYC